MANRQGDLGPSDANYDENWNTGRDEYSAQSEPAGNATGAVNTQMPARSNPRYAELVGAYRLEPGAGETLGGSVTPDKKALLSRELVTCKELVGGWADSPDIVKDCEDLMDSSSDRTSKDGDFILAYGELMKVRARLAQAWTSKRSKTQVIRLALWLLCLLAASSYAIIRLQLLPGWSPRVAVGFPEVPLLFASFLFGALGGIFDAGFKLSSTYTQDEFAPRYWLWYVCSPFLGALLGIVVFALILLGLVTTANAGITSGAASANTTATLAAASAVSGNATSSLAAGAQAPSAAEITKWAFVLLLAFIAGVKQITVTEFLEGIGNRVFGKSEQTKS